MNDSPLFDLIKTENDRQQALMLLENFSRVLFTQNAHAFGSSRFDEALKQTLRPDFETLPIAGRNKKIKELIDEVKSFPTVEVQVAVAPTDLVIERINQFVEKKAHTHSILDIQIKPEILGGVILIIDGKYYDFSVSKKLNEAFDNKKGDINSLIQAEEEVSQVVNRTS